MNFLVTYTVYLPVGDPEVNEVQCWHGHPGRLVANASEYKVVDVVHGSPGVTHTTERLPSWQAWAKPVGGGAVAVAVAVTRVARGSPTPACSTGSSPGRSWKEGVDLAIAEPLGITVLDDPRQLVDHLEAHAPDRA